MLAFMCVIAFVFIGVVAFFCLLFMEAWGKRDYRLLGLLIGYNLFLLYAGYTYTHLFN